MNEGVSWQYASYAIGGLVSLLFGILLTFIGIFTGDLRGRIKALEMRDLEQAKINTQIEISISELTLQFTMFIGRWKEEQGTTDKRNTGIDMKFDSVLRSIRNIELRSRSRRQDDDETLDKHE